MNNITISGRLGKDAVTRDAGDTTATGFSVAVDDGYGDKKKTLWFDCTMWGQRGEKLAPYLTKGTRVSVAGSVGLRTWDGDKGPGASLTVRVADVTLMGGGEERSDPPAKSGAKDAKAPAGGMPDDDIPF